MPDGGSSSLPKLRVHWWDAPGRGAEPTRLALTIKQVPFEDARIPLGEQAKAQAAREMTSFGQMPTLEIGGKAISQSATIMRCAAKLCGMTPDDVVEAAQIEEIIDFVTQDLESAALLNHLQGEEKREARKAAATDTSGTLHKLLGRLDSALTPMVDRPLNMAHLKVFCETSTFVSGFYDGFPTEESLFEPYPNIAALRVRVANEPEVKAYYKDRGGFYEAFGRLAK